LCEYGFYGLPIPYFWTSSEWEVIYTALDLAEKWRVIFVDLDPKNGEFWYLQDCWIWSPWFPFLILSRKRALNRHLALAFYWFPSLKSQAFLNSYWPLSFPKLMESCNCWDLAMSSQPFIFPDSLLFPKWHPSYISASMKGVPFFDLNHRRNVIAMRNRLH